MATFIYDGKSNLTATSADTVVITADPTLFTQASQNLNDAVLRFGANSLTITGATLTTGAGPGTLSNVTLGGGNFVVGQAGGQLNAGSSLVISTDGQNTGTIITGVTTADSKTAIFGGNGISSPNDSATIAQIGGQGSFLVYGNGGDDIIRQGANGTSGTAFDSTSAVTVFGGKGSDNVLLANTANAKASILAYGGESTDNISVFNTGNTTIFGGTGAGDSADGADSIALVGVSGGTINVFGNGGGDVISGALGNSATLTTFANNTVANIFGGTGSDSIAIGFDTGTTAKGTLTIYGGEDSDFIRVLNTGTTTIYGGTGQGDSTDGADFIGLGASGGTINVFGNAGADVISSDGTSANVTTFAEGTSAAVFGGRGNDSINLGFTATGAAKGTLAVYGGEDTDNITVANGVGGSTTVFGGTGLGDSADGADTINIGGSGFVNVFGNGGADTINLGTFVGGTAGTASANVVTVYAGTGNDSVNIGSVTNGTSTFNLSGNEGADTFVLGNTGATEVATTTFGAVANNQSFTLAGLTITGTNANALAAADIATAIQNSAVGTVFNATLTNGTIAGTLTGYSTGAANGAVVAFTSSSAERAVADLAPVAGGSGLPTNISISQGITSASTGAGVSVLDFTVGTDLLRVQNGILGGGTATITTVPAGGFGDLQAALNAASQGAAGSVSAVAFGGSTYVVTNNAGTGFDITVDSALKLTGVTDVNGVVNAITVL